MDKIKPGKTYNYTMPECTRRSGIERRGNCLKCKGAGIVFDEMLALSNYADWVDCDTCGGWPEERDDDTRTTTRRASK